MGQRWARARSVTNSLTVCAAAATVQKGTKLVTPSNPRIDVKGETNWALMETGILVRFDSGRVANPRPHDVAAVPNHASEARASAFVHGLRDTNARFQHDLVDVPCRVQSEDVELDYY
jgi:hypothetical protein